MSPTKKPKAARVEIEREASRYILHELGDQLWAGNPVYDKTKRLWSVSVHSLSMPQDVELGRITLAIDGEIVEAPSRRALRSEFKKHREKISTH